MLKCSFFVSCLAQEIVAEKTRKETETEPDEVVLVNLFSCSHQSQDVRLFVILLYRFQTSLVLKLDRGKSF